MQPTQWKLRKYSGPQYHEVVITLWQCTWGEFFTVFDTSEGSQFCMEERTREESRVLSTQYLRNGYCFAQTSWGALAEHPHKIAAPHKMPQKKPPPPSCPICKTTRTIRNGRIKGSNHQRYLCRACNHSWSDSPNPQGGQPLDDGLTPAERRNKWKRDNRQQCTERDRTTRKNKNV